MMKQGQFLLLTGIVLLLCVVLVFFAAPQQDLPSGEPSAATTETPTVTPTPEPKPLSILANISPETWSYYKSVALTSEFGTADQDGLIKKWTQPIYLYVDGPASALDRQIIDDHVTALKAMQGVPNIYLTENRQLANLTVSFVTQAEMNILTAETNEMALGYTRIWWDDNASITQGEIAIVYDEQTQLERQHTILEELTQSLGLMNDSDVYPDSIFYMEYADNVLALSDLDWQVVAIHYCDAIQPGMGPE